MHDPEHTDIPTQQPQQRRMPFSVLLIGAALLFVLLGSLLNRVETSNTVTSATLSDAPVSACDGVETPIYPRAPGTLVAKVNGQPVTHFYAGQPFQLVYAGDTGDTFAPQQLGVDADPYFDGSIQPSDTDSAPFAVRQQDISGTTITATVTFPFTHPKFPNVYTKPGSYCFDVRIAYTRPDGQLAVVVGYIGLVEEPANAS